MQIKNFSIFIPIHKHLIISYYTNIILFTFKWWKINLVMEWKWKWILRLLPHSIMATELLSDMFMLYSIGMHTSETNNHRNNAGYINCFLKVAFIYLNSIIIQFPKLGIKNCCEKKYILSKLNFEIYSSREN